VTVYPTEVRVLTCGKSGSPGGCRPLRRAVADPYGRGVTDHFLELVHGVMSSPWIYVVLFAVSMIDGFFPVVPGETTVITAGVFAATGEPLLVPAIAAAAAGAFAGDHVSYLIGRTSGARAVRRLRPGSRRRRAFDRAYRELARRGGLALVVARYIPGGRTAVTMTTGAVGYPRRRFAFFAAIAALSWAAYSGLIGYVGGMAFERDPVKGLLLGLGLALTITAVVEVLRYLGPRRPGPRARPRRRRSPPEPDCARRAA
jgi:membrane-associated protein